MVADRCDSRTSCLQSIVSAMHVQHAAVTIRPDATRYADENFQNCKSSFCDCSLGRAQDVHAKLYWFENTQGQRATFENCQTPPLHTLPPFLHPIMQCLIPSPLALVKFTISTAYRSKSVSDTIVRKSEDWSWYRKRS